MPRRHAVAAITSRASIERADAAICAAAFAFARRRRLFTPMPLMPSAVADAHHAAAMPPDGAAAEPPLLEPLCRRTPSKYVFADDVEAR